MHKHIRAMSLVLLSLFLITGLSACHSDSISKTYSVKAYNGGTIAAEFQGQSYWTGDGLIYVYGADGQPNVVAGTYSARRTDAGAVTQFSGATLYRVDLFSGGKVVETVEAYDIRGYGSGRLGLAVSGNREYLIVAGTYVARHIGAKLEGNSNSARFQVTAYSGAAVIGTWLADTYLLRDGKVFLTVNGIKNAVIVGGDYVVEQLPK